MLQVMIQMKKMNVEADSPFSMVCYVLCPWQNQTLPYIQREMVASLYICLIQGYW